MKEIIGKKGSGKNMYTATLTELRNGRFCYELFKDYDEFLDKEDQDYNLVSRIITDEEADSHSAILNELMANRGVIDPLPGDDLSFYDYDY